MISLSGRTGEETSSDDAGQTRLIKTCDNFKLASSHALYTKLFGKVNSAPYDGIP